MIYKLVKEEFPLEALTEWSCSKLNAKTLLKCGVKDNETDPKATTYFVQHYYTYHYPDGYFDDVGYCSDKDIEDVYAYKWEFYNDGVKYTGETECDPSKAYNQLLEMIPEEILNKLKE